LWFSGVAIGIYRYATTIFAFGEFWLVKSATRISLLLKFG
jgi:hypothetical protein